jgi:DNA helicase HerA-like ATPase
MIRLNKTFGIPARYANRHGLITGQTGTGKTITLMRLAEEFSRAGVPVFIGDVKGDIGALARSCPVTFVDLFDDLNVTFDAMGADLVARSLELTDAQSGVVEIAFAYARDRNLALATISDFRAVLTRLAAEHRDVSIRYGQAGIASIGVVQRALMRLEAQGGRLAFNSPPFDVAELLVPSRVTILKAERLMQSPRLYGAFLLWLLSDLYGRLPEVGDLPKPRLVFFFDEAHLLFTDCNPALLRRIEQTVRLIRSKGVGVYFVSQSAEDIPALVREQLAHRIEHDRSRPIGTARVSTLSQDGKPFGPVDVRVALPSCPLGPLTSRELPEQPRKVLQSRDGMPAWLAPAIVSAAMAAFALLLWWIVETDRVGVGLAALAGLLLFARGKL